MRGIVRLRRARQRHPRQDVSRSRTKVERASVFVLPQLRHTSPLSPFSSTVDLDKDVASERGTPRRRKVERVGKERKKPTVGAAK